MTTTNQTDTAQTPTNAATTPHRGDTPQLTVQALAASYARIFAVDTRSDGTTFWHAGREEDRPAGLSELIKTAHGDMFPDDYKYQFISTALCIIADTNEGEEEDAAGEMEVEIYNRHLTSWLSSNLSRAEYVDNYIAEYEPTYPGLFAIIGYGELAERQEVFYSVLSSLHGIVDDAE